MDYLTTIIGTAAAVCTTASYVPQVRKTWQTKETEDLSLRMLLLLAAGLSLWICYGVLHSDLVIVLANPASLALLATISTGSSVKAELLLCQMAEEPARIAGVAPTTKASAAMEEGRAVLFSSRAALTGSIASIVSSLGLGVLASLERRAAVQPLNATSHWNNGPRPGVWAGPIAVPSLARSISAKLSRRDQSLVGAVPMEVRTLLARL